MNNAIAIVGTVLALVGSYALAVAGEPQSQWSWCAVLGAC